MYQTINNIRLLNYANYAYLHQAIGVGFLASLTAMVFGWIPEGGWNMHHGMLLCASAILTASVASFGKSTFLDLLFGHNRL